MQGRVLLCSRAPLLPRAVLGGDADDCSQTTPLGPPVDGGMENGLAGLDLLQQIHGMTRGRGKLEVGKTISRWKCPIRFIAKSAIRKKAEVIPPAKARNTLHYRQPDSTVPVSGSRELPCPAVPVWS